MAKLTLTVDDRVIRRAKRYSRERGVSISGLVEDYLAAVSDNTVSAKPDTPSLRALRGILREGSVECYRNHLIDRYR
jgi:hypothetical protein